MKSYFISQPTNCKSPLCFLANTIFVIAILPIFSFASARGEQKVFVFECEKPRKLPVETDSINNARSVERKTAPLSKSEIAIDESLKKNANEKPKFHWKPALRESFRFLAVQHIYRMKQERTRTELDGKFFRDWAKSIKGLQGWQDSDGFFINWIAHPLQGGVTGRIFVNNSEPAKKLEFGASGDYWRSRFKAMIWSTVWSTQFELGPFSEASIGNVGIRKKRGRSTMAWIDLVTTPTLGTGVLIGEDAIDKYVLKKWLERKKGGRITPKIKILRSVLAPTTSFSNILRGKLPWKREIRR